MFEGGLWSDFLGLLGFVAFLLSLGLTLHVVLFKRDEGAAIGWVTLLWLAPIIGAVAYLVFGINRIQRRATRLRAGRALHVPSVEARRRGQEALLRSLPEDCRQLELLANLVNRITHAPLTPGNAVTPLVNGEAAYPEMIRAIDSAERSVALASYIFNKDEAGGLFVEALGRAVDRGVAVRVLIDGVGSYYSRPPIVGALEASKVPTARFLHSFMPWKMPFLNLRNHQKILVIDGCRGFTGGMNIKKTNFVERSGAAAVQDVHFRIEGPVVAHLMEVFAENWTFTTGEVIEGKVWFPEIEPAGLVIARGVTAGPDEDFERIRMALLGALSAARRSVKIVTPYFLPDESLLSALNVAAMTGIEVDIVIPSKSNLIFVDWAVTPRIEGLLHSGARIWMSPPPFDHSKLIVVDGFWSLIGSSNWDQRSLRLNFELNVECYDRDLAERLEQLADSKIAASLRLTHEQVAHRGLLVQLRDGLARLFTPYL